MKSPIVKLAIAAVAIGCSLSAFAVAATDAEIEAELNAMRAAVERFKDINVAIAEGYIDPTKGHCAHAAEAGLGDEFGGMGVHYIRPDLLQITAGEPLVDGNSTHTDFRNPAILLYEPQADGSMELVGVENLVFKKAWEEAGNGAPPAFLGRTWDYMENDPDTELDEAHGFEAHYDQHVWLFRDNPLGPLEPFNPNVTCEHAQH